MQNRLNNTTSFIFIAFFIATLAAGLSYHLNRTIRITPDSMGYGVVSRNIASGKGLILNRYRLFPKNENPTAPIPLTMQPPGYPACLALFGGVNFEGISKVRLVNTFALFGSVVGCCLIGFLLSGRLPGWICGIAAGFSFAMLNAADAFLAESLFLFWILYSITLILIHERYHNPFFLILAAIAASMATLTRYPGIVMAAVFAVGFLWSMYRKNFRHAIYWGISTFIVGLTAASLLLRNYVLFGSFRGYEQAFQGRKPLELIIGLAEAITFPMGVSIAVYKFTFLTLFILIPLVLTLFMFRKSRKDFQQFCNHGILYLWLFCGLYLVLIGYAMYRYQPHYESRFFLPFFPFLLAISLCTIWFFSESQTKRKRFVIRSIWTILLIGISFFSLFHGWERLTAGYPNQKQLVNSQTTQWILKNIEKNEIIGNRSQVF